MSAQATALLTLIFGVAGDTFAIPIHVVRDILDVLPVTDVPTARPFVRGLINVRGRVVPLVDLRIKLGLPDGETTSDTRFVVIETPIGGEPTSVALRADKVYEVGEIATVVADAAPQIGMRCPPGMVRAVGRRANRFVMILDLDHLFAEDAAKTP
ncbi:MAG: purine-binding chemotaxis protein CheW [Magnetococcales bacterium]|nr:purine-binding chemotaxis protein CheW [Magnetococcales bacterium]